MILKRLILINDSRRITPAQKSKQLWQFNCYFGITTDAFDFKVNPFGVKTLNQIKKSMNTYMLFIINNMKIHFSS